MLKNTKPSSYTSVTLCFSLIIGLLHNGEGHITQPEFKDGKLLSLLKMIYYQGYEDTPATFSKGP